MSIADGLSAVRARIDAACVRAGRDPGDVQLVAVSKTHGPEAVRAAYALGQRVFGENYVQELRAKAEALADLPDLEWHLIGHLQRNKVRDALHARAVVETVDTLELGNELAKRTITGRTRVLVQVNVARETQKSGCAPEALAALVAGLRALPQLDVAGLMTVPPAEAPEDARPHFEALRRLARGLELPALSMGMSADLEVAIASGATLVRVGTAIFGAREGGPWRPKSDAG